MFYEKYMQLCHETGKRPYAVSKELGLSSSNVAQWQKGSTPRPQVLQRIADYFGVPVSYFYGAIIEGEENAPTLTEKDERDIARDLERIMSQLGSSGDLMFDGDPMSDEARESMLAAMELGLRAAKLKNKARFTPKKHRKG